MSDSRDSLNSTGPDLVDKSTVDSEASGSRVTTELSPEEMLAKLQCPASHSDDTVQDPSLALNCLGADFKSDSEEDTVSSDCFDDWDSEVHSHVSSYSSWQSGVEDNSDDDDDDGDEDEDEDEDEDDEEEEEGEETSDESLGGDDESGVESIETRELYQKVEPAARSIYQLIIDKIEDLDHSELTTDSQMYAERKEAEHAAEHPDRERDGVMAEAADVGQSIPGIEETGRTAEHLDPERRMEFEEEIARIVESVDGINIKRITGARAIIQDDGGRWLPAVIIKFIVSKDQSEVIAPGQS